MADLTPEQVRRMHDFAEQLAELAEQQEDSWKVQTTDGQIFLTMVSRTAPHGLNVVRLRRQIEAQTPEVVALNDTNMGDPVTGLTKVPDLMVIAEEDTDDTPKVVNHSDRSEGPDGIRYRKKVPYAFGDTVTAGRWTLDTSSLKSYPTDW
ncbi:hypothetical protein ACIBEA_37365 [Streptomyces sp. NPDC051555]|uniref:hypothetical protein n=1 Tax=Streptomyces sp. NPDC051555 TaxID=3365657 RepID=UPI003798AAB5